METLQPDDLQELTTEQFQEELNRWFQDHGIITDLRSHLRHLMIAALQNTKIGLKPLHKSSPKVQTLNLLIAEYLLMQNCHYTLSIFTSEVPALSNFVEASRKALQKSRKIQAKSGDRWRDGQAMENEPSGNYFKESEVEEFLNALGLSSYTNQINHITNCYFNSNNKETLLECLLLAVTEMSAKLQIRQSISRIHTDGKRKGVSQQWSCELIDILMQSQVKSSQVSSIQEAIHRITENEVARIIEEENAKNLEKLVEREKRIQESLKKHEEELFGRLREAQTELKLRRDLTDKELSEWQKHLSKMAIEWKEKHDEIMKLSKKFHNVQTENQTLKLAFDQMGIENEGLKRNLQNQSKIIVELRSEITSLIKELKDAAEDNALLNQKIEILEREKNLPKTPISPQEKIIRVKENEKGDSLKLPELPKDNSGTSSENSPVNTLKEMPVTLVKENQTIIPNKQNSSANSAASRRIPRSKSDPVKIPDSDSVDEEDLALSSDFSSPDEIVAEAWKRFKILEEEANRIDQNYLEYKRKRCIPDSVSSESEKSPKKIPVATTSTNEAEFAETREKSTQRDRSPTPTVADFTNRTEFRPALPQTVRITEIATSRTPTKRQLKNRAYFLKSRTMLNALENAQLYSSASSNVDSSLRYSSSNDSNGPGEKTASFKKPDSTPRSSKSDRRLDSTLLTPLRTASFYCSDGGNQNGGDFRELEVENEAPKEETKEKSFPDPIVNPVILVEDADEAQVKISSKMSLRQQILMTDSDEDLDKNLTISSKSNRSQQSGNTEISVGKHSASDQDIWS